MGLAHGKDVWGFVVEKWPEKEAVKEHAKDAKEHAKNVKKYVKDVKEYAMDVKHIVGTLGCMGVADTALVQVDGTPLDGTRSLWKNAIDW